MIRHVLAVAALASVAGCSSTATVENPASPPSNQAQLAAYAATAEYPRDAKGSDDLRAAAIVDRKSNVIRILNFSDRPLNDVNVWVNGLYVNRAESIPPHGSVTLPGNVFYDRSGRMMSGQSVPTRVQIQAGDELYNVQGPVFE